METRKMSSTADGQDVLSVRPRSSGRALRVCACVSRCPGLCIYCSGVSFLMLLRCYHLLLLQATVDLHVAAVGSFSGEDRGTIFGTLVCHAVRVSL